MSVAEHGYRPAEIRAAYEHDIKLAHGRLRGQGCVPYFLVGIFTPEGNHELGWRTVEELYVQRGFVGSIATCPHAALYHSVGDGQAVYPERQAPTEQLLGRDSMQFPGDVRSWRIFTIIGLTKFWVETGRWPDFCLDPKLRYDCKVEAKKALGLTPK
jgi:hypothetical protein